MTSKIVKTICQYLLAYFCVVVFSFTLSLFLLLVLSVVIPIVDVSNTVYNTIGYDKFVEIFRLDSSQHSDITVWIILSPINAFLGYFLVNIVPIFLFKVTIFDSIARLKYENRKYLKFKLILKNALFSILNTFLIISFISIYQYAYSLLIFLLLVVIAIFGNILSWKYKSKSLLNYIVGVTYKNPPLNE